VRKFDFLLNLSFTDIIVVVAGLRMIPQTDGPLPGGKRWAPADRLLWMNSTYFFFSLVSIYVSSSRMNIEQLAS